MIGLPTLIRTSSDDNSVSPWFMRRFARILKEKEELVATDKTFPSLIEYNEFTTGKYSKRRRSNVAVIIV